MMPIFSANMHNDGTHSVLLSLITDNFFSVNDVQIKHRLYNLIADAHFSLFDYTSMD